MKFDVIIIGGGLAGLACGIRLAEQGKYCAIVSSGQNALHFSSGSLDLLAKLPDGQAVSQPLSALSALAELAPEHPYSKMRNITQLDELVQEAEALLRRCGLDIVGSSAENHLRLTPLGSCRPTWLSLADIPVAPLNGPLPWQRVAVIGIEGFLDFQPQMVASALQDQGIDATADYLHLPALDRLRDNPSEFRAVNIARILDLPENRQPLADELSRLSSTAEMILLPACIGLDKSAPLDALRAVVGKPIQLLPTLPPSLLGMRLHQALRHRFQQLGGLVMPGDAVLRRNWLITGSLAFIAATTVIFLYELRRWYWPVAVSSAMGWLPPSIKSMNRYWIWIFYHCLTAQTGATVICLRRSLICSLVSTRITIYGRCVAVSP